MKIPVLLVFVLFFLFACKNHPSTATTFCDTTCTSDSFKFAGDKKLNQSLTIGIKQCQPDTLSWTHGRLMTRRQIQFTDFLNQNVRLNSSSLSCAFQDTTCIWLAFNDCFTGRGFLLRLPYNNSNSIQKISGALNSFDPKFSVDPDLRAYTDRGSLYVVNVINGKQEQMTFKEEYPMDFNDIHKTLDSIHVTKERMFAKLIRDGNEIPFEKKISL